MVVTLQMVATWMMLSGKATFSEWSTFTQFVVGFYFGANVIGHVSRSEEPPPLYDAETRAILDEYKGH